MDALPTRSITVRGLRAKRPVKRQRRELIVGGEIKALRQEVKAMRPRTIFWGDSSCNAFREVVVNEILEQNEEPSPQRIIFGTEPIDLNAIPRPVPLISTTAGVKDLIGIPDSLSFIR
jgi:hypothetical protein